MRAIIIFTICFIANSLAGNAQNVINSTQHVGKYTFTSVDQVFVPEEVSSSSDIITQSVVRSYKLDIEILSTDGISDDFFNVNIYPNPISDKLQVNLGNINPNTEIELLITDLTGRQILIENREVNNSRKIELNLESFNTGVYLLLVATENRTVSKLLIKK